MFRDRTNLYLSYRRTFPHHNFNKKKKKARFESLSEEEQGLINDTGVELTSSLPPVFMDIADEIESLLGEVDTKVESLSKVYKKNLLPGFNDRTSDEEEIEKLNYIITSKFQNCFSLVKKLESMKGKYPKTELMMLENVRKNYAFKIQQATSNFRKLQNNYIKYLKEDDFEPIGKLTQKESGYNPALEEELETAEVENYSKNVLQQTQQRLNNNLDSMVRQREVEINKIAKGVLEVSTIFREVNNMVIEQGTILDQIDYNLENTKVHLVLANKELSRATDYQRQNNKCKLILLLILLVVGLFVILLLKPKNTKKPSEPVTEN